MKWSWKIARIKGIDVYIHTTFIFLVAWFGYYYWQAFGTVAAAINGMVYIVALFSCVVLHEFGHALVGRRYGIVTRKITLLPIGGVASMDKLPENPLEEIKVALAGPAVNVVIAALLWLWLQLNQVDISEQALLETGGPFAFRLMVVNIILVLFNLLPAFPMDGGRVLRGVLALRMKHHIATEKAALIGQRFALFFGFLGLFYNPFLILIAVFLWFGAAMENQAEQLKFSLHDARVKDAMLTEFHILSPEDSLSRAIQLTLAGSQTDFPVGTEHRVEQLLSQKDLIAGLQQHGEHCQVGKLDLPAIKTIGPDEPVQSLLEQVQAGDAAMLAVSDGERITGLINLENILELVQIQAALDKRRQSAAGTAYTS